MFTEDLSQVFTIISFILAKKWKLLKWITNYGIFI